MADEIRQQLTFDASQAIGELDKLNTALKSSQTALNDFGTAVGNINRQAGNAISAMNNLAQAAGNLRGATQGGIVPSNALSGIQQGTGLVDQFGNSLSSSASAAETAAGANQQAAQGAQQAGQAAGQATGGVQRLTVSFQTLARIIATQLTVRAFAAFTQGLRQATSDAIEFQKRIAEIQSIAQNAFADFDTAADQVRGISDAFNQPLGEVQEGLYQVISNQIRGAAAQVAVLESSANLAKVGVADLSDTVNLLTGTINAFQLNAQNANQIAGVFFETVRLGRTRISELATSFGTVAPLAAEAGLEFEELAGAFATITVNGVDTAKAATQLRGVINAFIKPTKELQQVLKDAGFSTGELAIETLGLGGALDLLQKATGGNTTELAKLVPRVRGLSGALVLARNEGQALEENIDSLRKTTDELLREKLEIRLETNAEQVESAINRVSNALTVDLGQAILESINTFGAANAAADILVGTIKILGPALVTLGTAAGIAALALGAYVLGAKASALANTALAGTSAAAARGLQAVGLSAQFSSRLLGLLGPAALAALGFTIGFQIGNRIIDGLEESAARAGDAAEQALGEELLRGAAAQQLEQERKLAQERIKNIKEVTKEQQSFLNKTKQQERQREEAFLSTNAKILSDTERLFDAILEANKQLLKDLEDERDNASDALSDSLEGEADLRQTLEDRGFRQSIGFLNERQQLFKLEARGAQIAAQANRALANARTAEQREAALEQFDRAEGFFEEAAAIAQSTGDLRDQARVFQSRQRAAEGTLRAEQEFQRTQAQIKADAEAALEVEKQRVRELNKQVEEAQKAIDAFQRADEGDPGARTELLRRAREEIADITPELAFGDLATGELEFGQLVSFTEFKRNLVEQVSDSGIEERVSDLLGGVKLTQLNEEFARASTQGVLEGIRAAEAAAQEAGIELTATIDLELIGSEQLQNVIDQLLQRSGEAQAGIQSDIQNQINRQTRDIAGQQAIAGAAVDFTTLDRVTDFLADLFSPNDTQLQAFQQGLVGITQDAVQLGQNLENVSFGAAATQIAELRQRFNQLLQDARPADIGQTAQFRSQLESLLNRLETANEKGLPQAVQDSGTVNQNLQPTASYGQQYSQGLQPAVSASAQIASNLQSAQVPTARLGGAISNFAKGGFVKYFANGGFSPKGTDTIPAMLSPGEFVVNARSTRRFFSQLQAINAGVQPVYRQEGGQVPVTSVGDINVTVNGSSDADKTGRTIARRIRRELRRGTSSL